MIATFEGLTEILGKEDEILEDLQNLLQAAYQTLRDHVNNDTESIACDEAKLIIYEIVRSVFCGDEERSQTIEQLLAHTGVSSKDPKERYTQVILFDKIRAEAKNKKIIDLINGDL